MLDIRCVFYYYMEKLNIFIKRLKKLNIDTTYLNNYPWIYLETVNNIRVTDKYNSEYGFVIGYAPIRANQEFNFTDLSIIFKTIRKYVRNSKN